ncbi:hypothetical protein [Streptomyces galbus]|uniref:Heparin-binding hemagglutinin n=1 Tax=Streptomyces galbus TaxID=33898 RepID=A0ABX1IF43_STRGB|nr:hypothetical protein [Streptomyces galbus]NKQ23830.1 hypothetical protein [Streptomyces galbus]
MAITDDLRKTLSDPTPLYFAAGTADLALQQAKKVPGLVEQLRVEAPARFEAVRNTDPKDVQEKAAARAKEAQETLQSRVTEFFSSLDGDLKKLGESAQDLALRSVGVAAEYAVKARETYEKVAEHGEQAVRQWRGEAAEGIENIAGGIESVADGVENFAVAVESDAEPKPQPVTVQDEGGTAGPATATPTAASASAKKPPAAKKTPAPRRTTATAKKTPPPAK